MEQQNEHERHEEERYLDLLRKVLKEGAYRDDRTGTGTYSLFGAQTRFSLQPHFPLLTTKKLHLRSIIHELLWFLKGNTNTRYLKDNKVTIWDEWADENGAQFDMDNQRVWPDMLVKIQDIT